MRRPKKKTGLQMMEILMSNLLVELRERGTDEHLCAKTLMPGAEVFAEYGMNKCAGMAWVRLATANPTVEFPNPDVTTNSCASSLAYTFEMGVVRQIAIPQERNNTIILPTDDDNLKAVEQQMDDLAAMKEAITRADRDIGYLMLGPYDPIGPDGGTNGGIWTLMAGNKEPDD